MPKEKLYLRIYNDLLQSIRAGRYQNGDRLPTEFELMAQYGVSRITARTAVLKLEQERLVQRIQKKGTFVQISSVQNKPFSFALILPYNNIFNYDIIQGVQNYGLDLNCSVPFYNTHNEPEKERKILESLLSQRCDGIILYPCSKFENIDLVSRLHNSRIPIVYMDRGIPGTAHTLVTSNNTQGVHNLVSRLIENGHRNIAYYGVASNMISTEMERFTGYCTALTDHGLEVKKSLIFAMPPQISALTRFAVEGDTAISDNTMELFGKLRQKNHFPDAVCCVNDLLAVSVLRAAEHFSLSVPKDIAVTGFDNLVFSQQITPHLTTVEQDFYQLGKTALDCLYKIANGETCLPRIEIETNLIVRASAVLAHG